MAGILRRARGARTPGAARSSSAERCGSGRPRATSPSCRARMPNLATLLADAGYTVAYKGKWHLTHPSGGDGSGLLGGWTADDADADRARLRLPRVGGARRRREREGRALRRRQRRRGARAGTRSTPARPSAGSPRRELPEPFCLVVSLVNPHDVLGYPASYERGGYAPERVPRPRRRPAADDRRGPSPQARGPLADADGDGRLHRPASRPPGAARLRQLLRAPAPAGRREDRPPGRRARRRRRPGLAALAHRGRALRRPRRDGPLARRPAAEDVQRLRGDDQRPAGDLEPGAVRRAGDAPRRSPRSSTCCRRCWRWPAAGAPTACRAAT